MDEVKIGGPFQEFPGRSFNEMQRRIKRLEAQRLPRRSGGRGGGDHFQIVRGLTTAAVSPSDVAFQIDNIEPYEQHSKTPTSPLWVKAPSGGVTLADNSSVWAIWRENVLTFDPGGGDVQVDWLQFEPGSTQPPTPVIVRVTGTITARSGTTKGSGSASLIGGADLTDVGDTITVYNLQSTPYVGGDGLDGNPPNLFLFAQFIGGVYVLFNFDRMSISGWDRNVPQSLGHAASGDDLWQDDETFVCPT